MPSKKLVIEQTNGETYDITVYDTKEECPEPNMYVTFAAENGVSEEGWIKLGEETDYGATQATFKDDSDGKVYHILKAIYYKAEIIQSDNQTIHVWTPQKDGGTDHTETFMVEAGTGWEAEVVPNSGYNAGDLSAEKKNEDEYPVLTDFTLYLYEGKPNSIKFTTPENAISPMNIGVYTSLTNSPGEVSTSPANYEIVPNTKYDVWIEDGSSNQRIASNPYILHMNDDSITGYCSSGNPIRFEFHIDTEKKNGLTEEEFQALIDGGYGPAPDNEGNVDLSWYATNYVEDCLNITELPEENKKYLDEVLTTGKYKVINMSSMFDNCSSLTSLDLSNWDTSNVTNMKNMFGYCNSLTSLDVSNWDTSSVTSMTYMFGYCNNLTSLDVSNWDTSNVTYMGYMFAFCQSLTSVTGTIDMSKVSSYTNIFTNCNSLQYPVNIKLPEDGSITEEQFLAQVTPASAKQAINFIGGGGI